VELIVVVEESRCGALKEALREATSARAVFADEQKVMYADGGMEPVILE
jgi:hypothetical protein